MGQDLDLDTVLYIYKFNPNLQIVQMAFNPNIVCCFIMRNLLRFNQRTYLIVESTQPQLNDKVEKQQMLAKLSLKLESKQTLEPRNEGCINYNIDIHLNGDE